MSLLAKAGLSGVRHHVREMCATQPTPSKGVRRALPRDRDEVTETVAAAFADDPGWAFIFGQDYDRLAAHFAGALFDVRVATSTIWVADDGAAVAMWDPPDEQPGTREHADSVWHRYHALAGEAAAQRLAVYNHAAHAVAPAEDHWYLGVLATRPSYQRAGLAIAVLRPVLDEADRRSILCCLETSTPENRRFYERRGFTQATEILLPGGPPTWWLERPPAPDIPLLSSRT